MTKLITITALLSASLTNTFAQTTATNWTATDCNSTSHTLFNELDNGKVIVMIWVMPCPSCVNGAKAVSSAVQGFATSNPGKVLAYLSDDMGDQTCSDLSTWMSSNSVGTNFTVFGNAGNTIDETNFGGSGMPHVVVMSGTDHKIYYNQKGSAITSSGITTAITNALSTAGVNSVNTKAIFSVSPNPVKGNIAINCSKAIQKVIITSMTGQLVKEENYKNGKVNPVISLSNVASGNYMISITDADGATAMQKIVKE
ncbi:MAG: T9SS type A sorting domain-containing protein [Bacteroidetes bacterium]|nr:T9SS type A sorting domain-containing protein [Bacteroidota bacterium]